MTAKETKQAPRTIVLNEEHIQNLEGYISEMPTRLGFPLINFLNTLAQQQANEKITMESFNTSDPNIVRSDEEI
jgi:hypothetical protein